MSEVLTQFRTENPVYKDTPNGKLAFGLWRQHYSDKLGMGEFADRVGLSHEDFGTMLSFSKQQGHEPTSKVGEMPVETGGRGVGGGRALAQGLTVGAADEVVAGTAAGINKLMGDERPYGEIYQEYHNQESQRLREYAKQYPMTATGMEITGAVLSPYAKAVQGIQIAKAGLYGNAALQSAAYAMPYAFLSKDGSLTERADEAVSVAVPAALFGMAGEKFFQVSKGMWNKVFKKSSQVPTIENLRDAKNKAYKLADAKGIKFEHKGISDLITKTMTSIQKRGTYVPETDKQLLAALRHLQSRQEFSRGQGGLTLRQLDKVQQALWERYNAGKGGEKIVIREIIDNIDDMIMRNADAGEAMQAARLANGRYKKAQTIDDIFKNIDREDQFRGADVVTKYKAAISQILKSPKKVKWFNETERAAMENFVSGNISQKVMQNIGKLSFTTNNFMAGLNMAAVAVNPALLALSATTAGAKAISTAETKAQRASLEALIRGAQIKPKEQSKLVAPIVASLSGQVARDETP